MFSKNNFWKLGLLVLNLVVLAAVVSAAWPSDLSFYSNKASVTVGSEFVVRLQVSPSGGPVDPFKSYVDASLALPAGLLSSQALFQDLSAYPSDTFTWHLNSSAAGTYQINIGVNGSSYANFTAVTVTGPVASPNLVVSVSDIPDHRLVGSHYSVTVTVQNTGAGDAKSIEGFLSAQKASISQTSFSIASLGAGASTSFTVDVVASSAGNGRLLANISSYKKSDDTLVSASAAGFSVVGAVELFSVNANPVVEEKKEEVVQQPVVGYVVAEVDNNEDDTVVISRVKQSKLPLIIFIAFIVVLVAGLTLYSASKGVFSKGWEKFSGFFSEKKEKKAVKARKRSK